MDEQAMVTADGGAMNSVLRKITNLLMLADNGSLPMDARSIIVDLKEELEGLHAFLLNLASSEESVEEERARSWMLEARDLSYRIEDILDGDVMKPDRKLADIQRFFDKSKRLLQTFVDKHRHFTEGIEDPLTSPTEGIEDPLTSPTEGIEDPFSLPYWNFRFELKYPPPVSVISSAQVPSQESPVKPVGIGIMRDGLINLLKRVDNHKLRVISIVGFRGLGKKTLAKEVLGKLKEEFECTAFVKIDPRCSTNVVLRKILSEVSRRELHGKQVWEDRQLISELREFLKDKKYFITVGDVHNASSWRIIKEALPENEENSRIMTTTCINSIANTCCPHPGDFVYEMKPLTSADSKSLFPLSISGPEVPEVYNDILKMSGYAPLALISLASILAKKESTKESWEEVRSSLCFAPGNIQELEDRVKILSQSYYDLPSNLKACALYLSILPVNHKIDREWLVRKWIAEGFVSEMRGLTPEDVANNFLGVLVDRNFIQPVDGDNIVLVERYQVHCMMLYLLKSISQQEKFITLLHAPDIQNSQSDISRRLSVYYPNPEDPVNADKMDLTNVHSITVFGGATRIAFENFNNMRVLDLEGCMRVDNANMKDICYMLLLKYLGLKETRVSELPQKIESLQHLETLDIRKTRVRELPKEAVRLRKLVNLLVGDSDIHQGLKLPEGSRDLKLLKVLRTIDLREHSSNILNDLGELEELRELELVLSYDGPSNNKQNNDIVSFLKKCNNLQSLIVYGEFDCCMDTLPASYLSLLQKLRVSRRFVKVPLWIAELFFLVQLDIRVCKLDGADLDILRELPSLERFSLGLEILPRTQPILISKTGFASLDTFCFDCKMPWLDFQEGAMPKLKHLELKFYGGLRTQIPTGTKLLINLKKVVLRYPQGCERNAGIKETIDALKGDADSHANWITMHRNGSEENFPWKLSADKGKQKIDG